MGNLNRRTVAARHQIARPFQSTDQTIAIAPHPNHHIQIPRRPWLTPSRASYPTRNELGNRRRLKNGMQLLGQSQRILNPAQLIPTGHKIDACPKLRNVMPPLFCCQTGMTLMLI